MLATALRLSGRRLKACETIPARTLLLSLLPGMSTQLLFVRLKLGHLLLEGQLLLQDLALLLDHAFLLLKICQHVICGCPPVMPGVSLQ